MAAIPLYVADLFFCFINFILCEQQCIQQNGRWGLDGWAPQPHWALVHNGVNPISHPMHDKELGIFCHRASERDPAGALPKGLERLCGPIVTSDIPAESFPKCFVEECIDKRVHSWGYISYPNKYLHKLLKNLLVAGVAQNWTYVCYEERAPHQQEKKKHNPKNFWCPLLVGYCLHGLPPNRRGSADGHVTGQSLVLSGAIQHGHLFWRGGRCCVTLKHRGHCGPSETLRWLVDQVGLLAQHLDCQKISHYHDSEGNEERSHWSVQNEVRKTIWRQDTRDVCRVAISIFNASDRDRNSNAYRRKTKYFSLWYLLAISILRRPEASGSLKKRSSWALGQAHGDREQELLRASHG